jgi:hypothetical protein
MGEAMTERPKTWVIEWRGIVTRDVGREIEVADTVAQAKIQFQSRYPMRRIISVTVVKGKQP